MSPPAGRSTVRTIPLTDLIPHPQNKRRGDVAAIVASIRANGWFGVVGVQASTGYQIWGHHRVQGAIEAARLATAAEDGWTAADGTDEDRAAWQAWTARYGPLTAVQAEVLECTDDEALDILLADNATSDRAEWDRPGLAALLADIADRRGLDGTGFTRPDLASLLAQTQPPVLLGDPDDEPPAPPAVPVTELGDLWLLGPHRLVCGDSRDPAAFVQVDDGGLADMVWTDPPYGVEYGEKNRFLQTIGPADRLEEDIAGDGSDPVALAALLGAAFSATLAATRPGAVWFVAAPAGPPLGVFAAELLKTGIWRQLLCWVKNAPVFGRSDYHYQHENLFYGWTPGAAHRPPPSHSTSSLWRFDRPMAAKLHPTMKPIGLIAQAIRDHTAAGETVLDPFAGSGSTLIAAHQEGRLARCIEIDPGYCDTICARWQTLTGIVPIRAGISNDFLAERASIR